MTSPTPPFIHLDAVCPRRSPLSVVVLCIGFFLPVLRGDTLSPALDIALGVAHFEGDRTEPRSDSPPRAIHAPPIVLTEALALAVTAESRGLCWVRVSRSGIVRSVEFSDENPPGAFARPIRQTLKTWRFDPILCDGETRDVQVPLRYFPLRIPRALDQQSTGLEPPRLLYAVTPTHPGEFITFGTTAYKSAKIVPWGIGPTSSRLERVERLNPKSGAIDVVYDFRPVPDQLMYVGSMNSVPWLPASVTVEFVIDDQGRTQNVRVIESSCPLLEPRAISAVRSRLYRPALQDKKPVASRFHDVIGFPAPTDEVVAQMLRPVAGTWPNGPGDEPPRFLVFAPPIHPTELAQRRKKGEATVEIHLGTNGEVLRTEIVKSTDAAFGLALREAVLASSFAPQVLGGRAVESTGRLRALFDLWTESPDPRSMPMPGIDLRYDERDDPIATELLDRRPSLIFGRPPAFRTGMISLETQAEVELEIVIDRRGFVRDPQVVSTPYPELGYTAVQASATWLFESPTKDGKPVAARMRISLPISPTPARAGDTPASP